MGPPARQILAQNLPTPPTWPPPALAFPPRENSVLGTPHSTNSGPDHTHASHLAPSWSGILTPRELYSCDPPLDNFWPRTYPRSPPGPFLVCHSDPERTLFLSTPTRQLLGQILPTPPTWPLPGLAFSPREHSVLGAPHSTNSGPKPTHAPHLAPPSSGILTPTEFCSRTPHSTNSGPDPTHAPHLAPSWSGMLTPRTLFPWDPSLDKFFAQTLPTPPTRPLPRLAFSPRENYLKAAASAADPKLGYCFRCFVLSCSVANGRRRSCQAHGCL